MKRMTTLKALERRIATVEEILTSHEEILTSHSESLYELTRDSIENRLGMRMLLEHLGLPRITAEQVDAVLDSG